MFNHDARKQNFINGLVNITGWNKENAEKLFTDFAPVFEIKDEIDIVLVKRCALD